MKVRYFGFLSPSFGMPFEQIKARIELAQGFNVKEPAPVEVPRPRPLRCPHCGAKLRYRRTILPCAGLRLRITNFIAAPLTMTQTRNSSP